ncbi:hypothetical protein H6F43_07740 [Leptolyngbya sp. FACHB-36]|uniref:hypothetical protein n=1 Tax=Leptolyngbya sp. FACHB-36 TaxID=2692808 RepID=UPI00168109EA|nr:hypothetical protein [Leptolyngbya sp. FACHB-36]MBD2020077.1 hypothetical protein [Leptolyngbya sp. FACHB-36]
MNLDDQIRDLIGNAPQDGTTPALVETIAPVLKQLAGQLRHSQYYIAQTLDQEWVMTTLENRTQPDLSKTVIYAFPSLKDVAASPYPMQDPQLIALPIPVTHILFQLLAMETIDSVIFFEAPGSTEVGTEIQRQDMNHLVQTYFQQQSAPSSVPPDIA